MKSGGVRLGKVIDNDLKRLIWLTEMHKQLSMSSAIIYIGNALNRPDIISNVTEVELNELAKDIHSEEFREIISKDRSELLIPFKEQLKKCKQAVDVIKQPRNHSLNNY